MAKFLQTAKYRGNHKQRKYNLGLFALPQVTECASQTFAIIRKGQNTVVIDRMRRDWNSYAKRLLKYERQVLHFSPLLSSEALGGKILIKSNGFDFAHFTPFAFKRKYGIFNDDMIVFGEFHSNANPQQSQNDLLQLAQQNPNSELVKNRSIYMFEDNKLTFEFKNYDKTAHIEQGSIEKIELIENINQTWKERFFYSLGNKHL